jgi:SAM-dependent methyltransferase
MISLPSESLLMRVFRRLGMPRVAWSLRRLHCPADRKALVLEVGAGGNPYPRANVLLDAYEETLQRMEKDLVRDRPTILGFVEQLPFKDKSFDFVIASHVLEHSRDPQAFLNELMRVGKSGYIETPDAFYERINPFTFHYLEVTDIDGRLRIMKKPSWRHDGDVVDLYEHKLKKDASFHRWASRHPSSFHVRYYWSEYIDYEIINPDVTLNWPIINTSGTPPQNIPGGLVGYLRARYLYLRRKAFSQNGRNRSIEIFELLYPFS